MKIKVQGWKNCEETNLSNLKFVIEDITLAQLLDICAYIDFRRREDPKGIYKDTFKDKK